MYRIRRNFHWLKISPMAHTLYCDKNLAKFNFTERTSYPPGSGGWTDQGTARGTVPKY